MLRDRNELIDCSEAFAFIGNSLLSPMNQTDSMGVDPAFWDAFPDFGEDAVREAIASCREYAASAQELARGGGDPVQRASVEYTKLFVGPPKPAAAPWETFYRSGGDGAAVGFGQATFEMRELLRNAGLEVSNDNNQYADHRGIELLLVSVLLERALLACEGALNVFSLDACQLGVVLAELVLAHQAVHLDISNLQPRRFHLRGCGVLGRVALFVTVASGQSYYSERKDKEFFHNHL